MTLPTGPVQPPPSVWEDLLEIFYAPRAVFERRRETPAFGLALAVFFVIMIVLAVAFRGLMEPVFDAEMKRGLASAMKANPNIPPEQMEAVVASGRKFAIVGIGVYALVIPLILGVLLWLAGKAVESKAEIGQMMMVTVYAMFPRVLETIANGVQLLVLPEAAIHGRLSVSLGPGRFLDPDAISPVLLAIVGRLDVFTLWVTWLMVVGLSVMGRITLARAAIAGAAMWLIGAIPSLWGALQM